MGAFKDALDDDPKTTNLARRKKELESLGEGTPGDAGSTKTKEEAVRRARVKADSADSDIHTDVNGKKYDRMKAMRDSIEEAGPRRR